MQWAAPWQSLKLPFQQLISYASLKRSVLSVSLSRCLAVSLTHSFSLYLSVCLSATPLALSLIRFAYCWRVRCLLSSWLHVQIRKVVQLPFIIRSVVEGVCGVMRVCVCTQYEITAKNWRVCCTHTHTRAHMLNATDQNAQRATFCYACAGGHTRRMTATLREKEKELGVWCVERRENTWNLLLHKVIIKFILSYKVWS